jgi:hypothetical protein
MYRVFTILCLLAIPLVSRSQNLPGGEEARLKLNLGTDLVSRYVWRGTDFGQSPAIQPTLSVSGKHLEFGVWGSMATNNSYAEVDCYLKYSLHGFTAMVTDYYVPEIGGESTAPDSRYFMYADKKTAHSIEASLQYKGDDRFPMWVLGGVFLYGNDKRWGYDAEKDSTESTYYSTYIEAGYTFHPGKINLDLFAGVTPGAGAYGHKAGLVNLGVTAVRSIRITPEFELPLKGSLIFNPESSKVFFVVGITL